MKIKENPHSQVVVRIRVYGEQVISDLYHEITPKASCWLAMDEDRVVGFCWGYPITIGELEEKIGFSFGDKIGCTSSDLVAYQDEVGVLSSYRGRKLAKAMVSMRHEDFLDQGLKVGIVRTRQFPEPSKTFLWYTGKLRYEILVTHSNYGGRVVLGRHLGGLKELLIP